MYVNVIGKSPVLESQGCFLFFQRSVLQRLLVKLKTLLDMERAKWKKMICLMIETLRLAMTEL